MKCQKKRHYWSASTHCRRCGRKRPRTDLRHRTNMTDKHFIDWESNTFGFGYGTGERHTILVLKKFFINLPKEGNYDYEKLEEALGAQQFWLLLNTLCHADIIEYGTSPRFGWLSKKGKLLKEYIDSKSAIELYELTSVESDYIHCYPEYCNCDGKKCDNPLFGASQKPTEKGVDI